MPASVGQCGRSTTIRPFGARRLDHSREAIHHHILREVYKHVRDEDDIKSIRAVASQRRLRVTKRLDVVDEDGNVDPSLGDPVPRLERHPGRNVLEKPAALRLLPVLLFVDTGARAL